MNISVGDRIKQRRIQLGIDADELAHRIGKSRATVYRYENGDIENMPTTILEPLAKILNTTPAYLMGWDEEDPNIQNRDADLEAIEKILSADGYALCCESYDDDYFYIKDSSGKTVAGLYDYELLPRYNYLKKKGTITAEMLLLNSFTLYPEEKDHINKYRGLDSHGKEMVDFTLQKEWERSVSDTKNKVYLLPQAAHNDHESEPGELEKMQEDLANLKRPE